MISKKLVAASSVPIVLSILSQGESYGYAIIQKVRAVSEGEMEWTDGMLYPVLHRLERDGLITSSWGVSENGRRRRYYSTKPAGERALEVERRQWSRVSSTLERLLEPATC